jgi:hypothetical protein
MVNLYIMMVMETLRIALVIIILLPTGEVQILSGLVVLDLEGLWEHLTSQHSSLLLMSTTDSITNRFSKKTTTFLSLTFPQS